MIRFRPLRRRISYNLRIWRLHLRYRLFELAGRLGWRQQVATGVVVSLTTFPLRTGSTHLVIRSLLAQTLPPERIVLYLARDEFPDQQIGAKLEALRSPRFDIVFVDENVRSFNKLVHALRQFPRATIISCDDDRIYRSDLVRSLVRAAAAHPGEVISWSARRIPHGEDGCPAYKLWPPCRGEETGDILPLGYAGILYPAGCFPPDVVNREIFLALAPTQDDLWFRTMSARNGVRSRTLGQPGRRHRVLHFANNRRLVDANVAGGANDRAIRALEAFYGVRFGEVAADMGRSLVQPIASGSALSLPSSSRLWVSSSTS